jgi:hypothetical protein
MRRKGTCKEVRKLEELAYTVSDVLPETLRPEQDTLLSLVGGRRGSLSI